MEHANYEYNTRHGLEHMLDYWLRMIVGRKIWTHIPSLCNYIFQGILGIFSNIYALCFIFSKLQTTDKVESALSIVTVSHVSFSIDIRSNQFRVNLII